MDKLDEPDRSQEFDIEMTKVGGSLGFTLRKADSSALGHYVRALVREPALSDGRIRPGDKIVAVDGAPLSPMSHEEAVQLLRQCGPTVKLRLYRDLAQTPVSALSPTEPDHPLRPPRTSLRYRFLTFSYLFVEYCDWQDETIETKDRKRENKLKI